MGNKEFTCASILTFIFSLIVSIYFLGSPGILFTYMWFFTGFGAFLILRFFVKVFLILLSIAALFVGVFFLSQYWIKINEILSMIVPLDLGLGPLLLFWIIILIILVTFRIIIDPTTKWIYILKIVYYIFYILFILISILCFLYFVRIALGISTLFILILAPIVIPLSIVCLLSLVPLIIFSTFPAILIGGLTFYFTHNSIISFILFFLTLILSFKYAWRFLEFFGIFSTAGFLAYIITGGPLVTILKNYLTNPEFLLSWNFVITFLRILTEFGGIFIFILIISTLLGIIYSIFGKRQ